MKNIFHERVLELQTKASSALIGLINTEPPLKTKMLALKALGRIKTPSARETVCTIFAQHSDEEEALEALSTSGGEEALAIMLKAAKNPSSKNRDLLVESIAEYKTRECFEFLREMLKDSERLVRAQAAFGLFNHGGREAALALCQFISDPDEWISMNILKLLCRLKEHESIPFLAEQYSRDEDIRRKAQMVSFLSRFRSVTLLNIFDDGLKSHDARLKANSIEAIGELELPPREISSRIMPYLKDPNNRIRANAILALVRTENEVIKPLISDMAKSDDIQLRRSAAYILSRVIPEGYEDLASKLCHDESDDVRKRMILSLKSFPKEFSKGIIENAISDSNPWIRKYAVEIVSQFPDFPVQAIIKQFRQEDRTPNIVACMNFFSTHYNDEAVKSIKNRMRDKRPEVVKTIVSTLGKILGFEGLKGISRQINYHDPQILRAYSIEYFSLGGKEIFQSVVDKAVQPRIPSAGDLYLPTLEGCLELLDLGEKMPKNLMDELSRIPQTEILPPPKPVEEPPKAEKSYDRAIPADGIDQKQLLSTEFLDLGASEGKPEEILEKKPQADQKLPKQPKIPHSFQAGVKFFHLGKYRQAKKAFFTALEENSDLIKAHLYIGLMAWEQKDAEQARESLSRFLASEPENTKALHIMGKIYKGNRDWENLVKTYDLLLKIGGTLKEKVEFQIRKDLGIALEYMKRFEDARPHLEDAYRIDPDDEETAYYLSMAYYQLKNFLQSETTLMELLRTISPKSHLYTMANSLLDKIRENISAERDQNKNFEDNDEGNSISDKEGIDDFEGNEIPDDSFLEPSEDEGSKGNFFDEDYQEPNPPKGQ
ncbi:MAG: HEAT repeat domain-containing protein [Candidatus Riflebacteria bacterium]|nr:HEAT repeat domain-containing protein [Candidatus Riflebacteria bacterium]